MSRRSKRNSTIRVKANDVAVAIKQADWKRIDKLRDRDITRAIKDDPDAGELDLRRPVEVILPATVDVAAVRRRLHLSQTAFARRIGVSARLVSDWEQGRQKPTSAARALLLILDELGAVALRALARRVA
jgi:putative transcriptional regulator